MWRTKIITRTTTSEEQLLQALPDDFYGHITFDADSLPNIQVCMIYHTTYVNRKQVYDNLGIKHHNSVPLFLFEKVNLGYNPIICKT